MAFARTESHCGNVVEHDAHPWDIADHTGDARWQCNGRPLAAKKAPRVETTVNAYIVPAAADMVNHPPHYTSHPSGIEVIEITRHMGFNLGNVVKYAMRCDLKHDAIEDLKKAAWYLADEITKREKAAQ